MSRTIEITDSKKATLTLNGQKLDNFNPFSVACWQPWQWPTAPQRSNPCWCCDGGAPRSTTTCRRRRWWWGRVTLSRSCSWFLPFWMSLQSSVGHWIQHQSHLLFSLLSLQKTHFPWKRSEVASFGKTPACGGRICEPPQTRRVGSTSASMASAVFVSWLWRNQNKGTHKKILCCPCLECTWMCQCYQLWGLKWPIWSSWQPKFSSIE